MRSIILSQHRIWKREKAVKPLEKLDVISDKNKKQLNDFIIWLTDNNDYSSHTVYIYYTSMKKYFEYANEVNMDNCRRFIKVLKKKNYLPLPSVCGLQQ